MKGFRSSEEAGRAADKLALVGLYGPGQRCGSIPLPYGGWAYETACAVWGGEPRPTYVLRTDGGEVTVVDEKEFTRLYGLD